MIKSLSSAGMLFFLLALLLAILVKSGILRKEAVVALLKTVGICFCFALLYDGAARLTYMLYNGNADAPRLRELYGVGWLIPFYEGLETGSGIWNLPGYCLGKILCGEAVMGGTVFSLMLTMTGLHLIYLRLCALRGEKCARSGQALLLAFPGVFFCFLPGWAAWAFLAASGVFFCAGKYLRRTDDGRLHICVNEALFACFMVANGMLLTLAVLHKLG